MSHVSLLSSGSGPSSSFGSAIDNKFTDADCLFSLSTGQSAFAKKCDIGSIAFSLADSVSILTEIGFSYQERIQGGARGA